MNSRYLSALLFLLLTGGARADFFVVVGDWTSPLGSGTLPTFQAGANASIPVYAYTNEVGTKSLSAYVLTFDFDTAGKGVSPYFSGFNANFSNSPINTTFNFTSNGADFVNMDFIVSASTANTSTQVTIPFYNGTGTPSAVKLFDLNFQIASNAPTGTFDFKYIANGLQSNLVLPEPFNPNNLVGTGFSSTTTRTAVGGQFQVTAVPEPSSMIFASVGALGLLATRMRRRKK